MLSPIFSIVSWWRRVPAPRLVEFPEQEAWLRDPLSHPSIARMSMEEIADLPARQLRARLRS